MKLVTLEEYNNAIKLIRQFHSQIIEEIETKQSNVIIGDYVHHIKGKNGLFDRNKDYKVVKLGTSKPLGPVFGIENERGRLTWISQSKLNVAKKNGGVWVKSEIL